MAPQATSVRVLTVETQIEMSCTSAGGLGSVKNFGNSLKMGGCNKFERFNDGLEMSESTRRMEGFGSGR